MKWFIVAFIGIIVNTSLVAGYVDGGFSPRFGASAVNVETSFGEFIFLTGGMLTAPLVFPPFPDTYENLYCDVQSWDFSTGNFYERSSSQMSCCRAHHSAVNWNNTYIVVFGGAGTNNQVEMFNVAEDFWEVVPTWGNAPSGRYGHAAALVEDTMFIFGGVDADTKQVLNDFWALNLNTFAWTQLEFPFGPTARTGARILPLYYPSNGRPFSFPWFLGFILFGGSDNEYNPTFYNDIWVMRIKPSILYGVPEPEGQEGGSFYGWRGGDQDNGWREGDHDNGSFYGWRGGDQDNNHKRDNMKRELAPAIMPDIWEWKHVTPTGPQPVERSLYGGFISQENLFVIFGGATWGSDGYRTNQLNDMWAIDTKTWFFPPFKQVGTGDLLYPGWIFGEYGQWLYGEYGPNENYEAPQWKQITPPATTDWPKERADFSFGSSGNFASFVIFGGQNNARETVADVWSTTLDLIPNDVITNEQLRFRPWYQRGCWPGYEFPWCTLNCRFTNYCNWHGTCLPEGHCQCDEGWLGDTCDYSVCDGYRGFTTDALNEILLPKSIESMYIKLDVIFNKLMYIRELLPTIDNTDADMTGMAQQSYNFYRFCLVNDLCETTSGFQEVIGCDVPCGSQTYCIINDTCVNGVCMQGIPRDCSEEYADNKCVTSWCDEENGCMHSTVTCVSDPNYPCSTTYCDPKQGCVTVPIDCDDDNTCTIDYCDAATGQCVHWDKCEDNNPCTMEMCKVNDVFDTSLCFYSYTYCCFPSEGQNADDFGPVRYPPRNKGEPLWFAGHNMIPPQPTDNTAYGWFWVQGCGACQLFYDISSFGFDGSDLWVPGTEEEATHIYAFAGRDDVAGVVGTLPLGRTKQGSWNYCDAGFTMWDLFTNQFYAIIHTSTGHIRTQLEFDQTFGGNYVVDPSDIELAGLKRRAGQK